MNELYDILDCCRSLCGANKNAVIATVVHVTGSTYRRPGARMLIVPDGRSIGSVSGGCLEGEIIKRAWWLTESGAPALRAYDTSSDNDGAWEFGLGCNGVVHVLLERVNTPAVAEMIRFLELYRASSEPAAVATVIRTNGADTAHIGDRLLADKTAIRGGILEGTRLARQLLEYLSATFREKKSRLVHLGETDVFIEWIGPPLSLFVFGAGHDAIPLVHIAAQLGWRVTVADGRPAYARSDRFPEADRTIVLSSCGPLRDIDIDQESAVVLMTHNVAMDARLLPEILDRQPRYVGLLGPRARAQKLFDELDRTMPLNVHAPAGLDIGCDNPTTIALSITAEIQTVWNFRSGKMLTHRTGAIHVPALEIGEFTGPASETVRPAYCETTVTGNV